jgi:hypothetical protein
LPDLGVWVETKGLINPLDELDLPTVAQYLKEHRQERLFMYKRNKAYIITPNGFREIAIEKFWTELMS